MVREDFTIREKAPTNGVPISHLHTVKALVGTFNQEKVLAGAFSVLRDYEPSYGPSFEALVNSVQYTRYPSARALSDTISTSARPPQHLSIVLLSSAANRQDFSSFLYTFNI